jgi:hypothetical protein
LRLAGIFFISYEIQEERFFNSFSNMLSNFSLNTLSAMRDKKWRVRLVLLFFFNWEWVGDGGGGGVDGTGGKFFIGIILSIKTWGVEDLIDFAFLCDGCRFFLTSGLFFAFLATGCPLGDGDRLVSFLLDAILFLLFFFFFWGPSPLATHQADEKVKTMVKSSSITTSED